MSLVVWRTSAPAPETLFQMILTARSYFVEMRHREGNWCSYLLLSQRSSLFLTVQLGCTNVGNCHIDYSGILVNTLICICLQERDNLMCVRSVQS